MARRVAPPQLAAAQRTTLDVASAKRAAREARPGMSEIELRDFVELCLREAGCPLACSLSLGDDPEHVRALETVRSIHEETLARCRPGMEARELIGGCRRAIEGAGYRLLDPWSNIGHSLCRGSACDKRFIDATNERPMWGAWAIEPPLGTDALGVKLEDVVWFDEEGCTVL